MPQVPRLARAAVDRTRPAIQGRWMVCERLCVEGWLVLGGKRDLRIEDGHKVRLEDRFKVRIEDRFKVGLEDRDQSCGDREYRHGRVEPCFHDGDFVLSGFPAYSEIPNQGSRKIRACGAVKAAIG